jgi:hypothetical protein
MMEFSMRRTEIGQNGRAALKKPLQVMRAPHAGGNRMSQATEAELEAFGRELDESGLVISRDENQGITYQQAIQILQEMAEGPLDATVGLRHRSLRQD